MGLPLSIDTYHAEVARRALEAGVAMVNDVSGLGVDPALAEVVARAKTGLVLMHSLGAPDALHAPREYLDVGEDVRSLLAARLRLGDSRRRPRERIDLGPRMGSAECGE